MNKPLNPDRTAPSAMDQRTYIRLRTIFPVEYAVIYAPEDLLDIYWQQGYTKDIGTGGICLEMIVPDEETLCRLQNGPAYLELRVGIPLRGVPTKARARVSWFEKIPKETTHKYRVGLKFTSIAPLDLHRMVNHARWLKFSSRAAVMISVSFFVLLIAVGVYGYRLRRANEALVNRLVAAQQEEIKIHAAIQRIIEEGSSVLGQIEDGVTGREDRKDLEKAYQKISQRKEKIEDYLGVVEREKEDLQATVLEKMHLWLKNHQSPSTGLVLSVKGDDPAAKGHAFVHDQALTAQVFLSFGNDKGARQILDFFYARAGKDFQGFSNAYDYRSGEAAEKTVYSSPNIWIGVAALQYTHKTGDKYYLPMARRITDWLIAMQEQNPDGGIKGGEGLDWFAVEHNGEAYALFHMMYEVTKEQKYADAQKRTLSWLRNNWVASKAAKATLPSAGQASGGTLVTDTQAWLLAALGPQKLKEIGHDPEKIMEWAEEHCVVEAQYERPSGIKLSVRGFDLFKSAQDSRDAIIYPEWTAQMVIAFRLLSEYFVQAGDFYKGTYYEEKAKSYLGEMNKLIIPSSSTKGQGEGCLPYATRADIDTGHGFSTPYGTSACSIPATAYMIMAIKHWNPLGSGGANVGLKATEGSL